MASRRDKRKSVIFGRNSPKRLAIDDAVNAIFITLPNKSDEYNSTTGRKRTTARCLVISPEAGKCEFTTRQERGSRETDEAEVQAVFFQLYFPDMHTNWQDSSTARRLVGWCNCSGRQFLRLKCLVTIQLRIWPQKCEPKNKWPEPWLPLLCH